MAALTAPSGSPRPEPLALTITPGKVGELLKSYLLRSSYGLPIARTAPMVLADRVTDLLALLALALSGVGLLGGGRRLLIATALLLGLVLLAAASERLVHLVLDHWARLPLVGASAPKLRQAYQATAELLSPAPLAGATALSVLAWLCECVAFYLVLRGFPAAHASLRLCTFIYAAMTVAGALSFLPGGLGVQEGGMVELLILMGRGIGTATAFAATFVTRLCTLWFAVALGVLALLLRRQRVADLQELVE